MQLLLHTVPLQRQRIATSSSSFENEVRLNVNGFGEPSGSRAIAKQRTDNQQMQALDTARYSPQESKGEWGWGGLHPGNTRGQWRLLKPDHFACGAQTPDLRGLSNTTRRFRLG